MSDDFEDSFSTEMEKRKEQTMAKNFRDLVLGALAVGISIGVLIVAVACAIYIAKVIVGA